MPTYPISFSMPPEKIVEQIPEKTRIVAHIIPGNLSTYIYDTEESYYQGYKESFFAVTMKKGGWDCMRHYEILANGCIPYFVDLENIPQNTMTHFPKEIIAETNKIYLDIIEKKTIDEDDIKKCNYYIEKLLNYTRTHLSTTAMAAYILSKVKPVKNILFLSGNIQPDYLRCLTLSGLKHMFGTECHDYPKVPHIYKDYLDSFENFWGKGITYTKNVDPEKRNNKYDDTIVEDIVNHKYDIIIYGSYHRGTPFFNIVSQIYDEKDIVFLCGEDCDLDNKFVNHNCKLNEQNAKYNLFIRELE
jgi:hypothetical protein